MNFVFSCTDLPRFIKKMFSGLKKFISSYPQLFYFDINHDFNPKVHLHLAECAPEVLARGSVPCPQPQTQVGSMGSPPHQQMSLKPGNPPDGNFGNYDIGFGPYQQNTREFERRPSWDTHEWGPHLEREVWSAAPPQPQQQPQQPLRGPVYGNAGPRAAMNHHPLPSPPQQQPSLGRNNVYNQQDSGDRYNQYDRGHYNLISYNDRGHHNRPSFNSRPRGSSSGRLHDTPPHNIALQFPLQPSQQEVMNRNNYVSHPSNYRGLLNNTVSVQESNRLDTQYNVSREFEFEQNESHYHTGRKFPERGEM